MKKHDLNDMLQTDGEDAIRARLEAAHSEQTNGAAHLDRRIMETALGIQHLEFVNALDLLSKPAPRRQWTVEPWIPFSEVTLLGGDGGIGKSTIALQLAVSSAADLPWFGLDVRQGAALYLSCEDPIGEVHFRLEQIQAQHPDANLSQLHILDLAGKDAILAAPSPKGMRLTKLFERIEEFIERQQIRLLVLDSSADVFGGSEIDRAQTRGFVQALRGLAIRRGCAVILLAHPSVDGMKTGRGYSGNTAWNNSVRARLYFIRATSSDGKEPDPDLRVLEIAKNNRGKTGQKIFMRWHNGCFVLDGAHEAGVDRLARELTVETLFLELLDTYTAQDRGLSPNPSVTYAPTILSQDPAAKGVSKKALRDAMNILLTAGKIKIETKGPQSKQRQRLVRAADYEASE